MKIPKRPMNQVEQIAFLQKGLGYVMFDKPVKAWLRTGSKLLSGVLASKSKGIPYGKLLTLAGKQSSGKSLLAIRLMGKAQQDGAMVGWVDVENSFDAAMAKKQGLDPGEPVLNADGELMGYSNIALFQPEFGVFKATGRQKAKANKKPKKKTIKIDEEEFTVEELEMQNMRQQTAEELFELVKSWMKLQKQLNPKVKIALAVDSTTSLQPEEELSAGLVDANMRTGLSLARFLNQLTKELVALALNTNCFTVLISQLRTNPTKMFSDPDYVPGGNGVLFYPSSICWMKRLKNITSKGLNVGLESIIINKKNKMGGESVEGLSCGIRMFFQSSKWEFVEVEEIKKKEPKDA